jgi:hypothetical protein
MKNLGMEKRPLRFSLHEAFFEGSRTDGREDCLSTLRNKGYLKKGKKQTLRVQIQRAEFRNAEKNVSGTALRT